MLIYPFLICLLSYNCYFFVHMLSNCIRSLERLFQQNWGETWTLSPTAGVLPPPACRRRSNQTEVRVTGPPPIRGGACCRHGLLRSLCLRHSGTDQSGPARTRHRQDQIVRGAAVAWLAERIKGANEPLTC